MAQYSSKWKALTPALSWNFKDDLEVQYTHQEFWCLDIRPLWAAAAIPIRAGREWGARHKLSAIGQSL
jgi:hypothetical protein